MDDHFEAESLEDLRDELAAAEVFCVNFSLVGVSVGVPEHALGGEFLLPEADEVGAAADLPAALDDFPACFLNVFTPNFSEAFSDPCHVDLSRVCRVTLRCMVAVGVTAGPAVAARTPPDGLTSGSVTFGLLPLQG
jgi:hypothetical protein